MEEDAPLCRYGTPLDPLEEDEIPSKKPVAIEDQIVTDENGKRRFHGAFTGGFSAGFWNTVGSLEGWKPQSFKSSRSEKAEKRQQQLPTDFMDDEDLGEFGIAPQRIQAREDFSKTDDTSSSRKRKLPLRDSGAIPGIPVLQQLLEPAREKVAVRLLKRMGWKPNQGIGARQTRKEKNRSKQQNNREMYVMKMYGCTKSGDSQEEISPNLGSDGSEEDDDDVEALTFAPDDYEPFTCSIKDNVFGLGYSGLSRQVAGETRSHINLFGPLEVLGKDNKKLSIRGQAFGVGALEEEDEDIYARDDMTKYDFSLGDKKKREKSKLPKTQDQTVLEGFAEPSQNSNVNKIVHIVELKANFQPRNFLHRKSRFDPLPEEKLALLKQNEEGKRKGLGRHDLNPDDRRSILEGVNKKAVEQKAEMEASESKKSYLQQINEKYKEREDKTKRLLELISSKEDNFVKGGLVTSAGVEIMQSSELDKSVDNENQKILSEAKKLTKSLDTTPGVFKPFASNEAKQERYEKFLEANLKKEEDIKAFLITIQPVHLSEWDREMELKEFVQAKSIYKPLNGMMSERFVSKTTDEVVAKAPTNIIDKKITVVVKRTKVLWKPCSLICKRFNIPEPFGGTLVEPKVPKKNKFSVFDYIENSINSKKDFVTPVIIPKHIEKPKAKQVQPQNIQKTKSNSPVDDVIPSTSRDIQPPESPGLKKPLVDSKKPKTELELRIEESKNKHPSEKKDLFKCIFDSSSEDEEDDEDKATKNEDETKSSAPVIPADIADSLVKPSAPINILRNHSPPRGIFAALFAKPEVTENQSKKTEVETNENSNKITFKPKHERNIKETSPELENTYGPKIPDSLLKSKTQTSEEADIDKRLAELLSSKPIKATRIVEEWVEKKSGSSKKSKKEKREKKKKKDDHKHKKSKKHKKDKK
ncbi:G patch domain-containing protein 1 homolog [Episyrphus balteatus]|uniref:G patch domain-containing protein 1 homolog n=1 Tax=Episyrphus balteatus TaxID=286459 RepID=UPI0024867DE9|nr:G patch domain-containing protein 1 homolog [Episyrphus balteatus]